MEQDRDGHVASLQCVRDPDPRDVIGLWAHHGQGRQEEPQGNEGDERGEEGEQEGENEQELKESKQEVKESKKDEWSNDWIAATEGWAADRSPPRTRPNADEDIHGHVDHCATTTTILTTTTTTTTSQIPMGPALPLGPAMALPQGLSSSSSAACAPGGDQGFKFILWETPPGLVSQ